MEDVEKVCQWKKEEDVEVQRISSKRIRAVERVEVDDE